LKERSSLLWLRLRRTFHKNGMGIPEAFAISRAPVSFPNGCPAKYVSAWIE